MTDGNLLLKQYELEDKIAGQRLEIKRLRDINEKLHAVIEKLEARISVLGRVNHGSPSEEKKDGKPNDLRA